MKETHFMRCLKHYEMPKSAKSTLTFSGFLMQSSLTTGIKATPQYTDLYLSRFPELQDSFWVYLKVN